LAVACGSSADSPSAASLSDVQTIDRASPAGSPALAAEGTSRFGWAVFDAARDGDATANAVVSPLSLGVAFAMVEPGASNHALTQLHAALGIDDPDAFLESVNALTQSLEARPSASPVASDVEDPGEVDLALANAAFVNADTSVRPEYLDRLGRYFGPAVLETDFADPARAAEQINGFIAENTNDRITDVISAEMIDPASFLSLVNALYLRAPWLTEFTAGQTTDGPFHLIDGSTVEAPLMHGMTDGVVDGDRWIGMTKNMSGDLRLQVIVPDDGYFGDLAADPRPVFDQLDVTPGPPGDLVLPRLDVRVDVDVKDLLPTVGLGALLDHGGLLGMIDADNAVVGAALHAANVIWDEEGAEASAATVIVAGTEAAAPVSTPVIVDRPFLFRINDAATGTDLFVGQILDPTA
jgi:serpin B